MKKLILILILAVGFTVQGQMLGVISSSVSSPEPIINADYYVSSSQGNDANDGSTPALALKTLSAVQGLTLVDGDTIAFKGGDVWKETLVWDYKGAMGVTLTSYGTGQAKFSGTEDLDTWTNEGGNLWSKDVTGKTVYHVLKSDEMQTNGRVPKIVSDFIPLDNYYTINSTSSTTVFICTNLIGSPDLVGGYVYINTLPQTTTRRTITAFNSATGEITIDSNISSPISANDLFFINNHVNLVTTQDDWSYDATANKVYYYSTSEPTDIEIITNNSYFAHFEGTSGITIDNIEINGFNNNAIYYENTSNNVIKNSTFKNNQGNILFCSYIANNFLVENNIFESNNGVATYLYGSGIDLTFINNTVQNVGLLSNIAFSPSSGTGTVMFNGNASGNVIKNTGYNGISWYGSGIFEYNYVENTCLAKHDGSAIYTYDHANYSAVGSIIRNNIVRNTSVISISPNWFSHGIYCDDNSKDMFVTDNSIEGFYYNIFSHNNQRNTFTGNKLYNSVKENFIVKNDAIGDDAVDNTISNNEFYNDNINYDGLKVYNELANVITQYQGNNNKFFNPQRTTDVYVATTIQDTHKTLAEWNTLSGQDSNSYSDLGAAITASNFYYNETNTTRNQVLNAGTWYELDGTSHSGNIDIAAYSSVILIDAEPVIPTTAATPVLSNFNIDNINLDRVNFDASSDVTGMTTTGFVVSGKTISFVTIDGDGLGGYFTVSTPFTFWDNNTIRLGEITDTVDRQTILHNFTLEYIENNIPEPLNNSSNYRYVTNVASGGGNGLTEGTAWTWAESLSNAAAGMTIWVKAGEYGQITNTYVVSGTITSPIKWIGYKTTIGDITSNYFDYGVSMSTSEMPTISGISSNRTFYIAAHDLIFRNLQVRNAGNALYTGGTQAPYRIIMDNFNVEQAIKGSNAGTAITFVGSQTNGYYNIRIKNSVVIDAEATGISVQGTSSSSSISNNLIESCKVYTTNTTSPERLDYSILLNGENGIIRNCYIESFNHTETSGSTHGIGIRGVYVDNTEYILIEKCTAVNFQEAFYFRNCNVNNSVIKNNIARNNGSTSVLDRGGIQFSGGVKNCVAENNIFQDLDYGIVLAEHASGDNEGSACEAEELYGSGNIIRNNIFNNILYAIMASSSTVTSPSWDNNLLYNNTFKDCNTFFDLPINGNIAVLNFRVFNNIIDGSSNAFGHYANFNGFVFDYNDFYNSWITGIGSNDININPNFVNTTDFVPQATLSAPRLFGVEYDYNGEERESTTTIGAQKGTTE